MKLYWLDLETTGLDPREDVILEVAISEADLATPFEARPIYHATITHAWVRDAETYLEPFILDMHTKNGLLAECLVSSKRIMGVESEILDLIPPSTDRDEQPTLAGSSVHFDHAFLRRHMPTLGARFSHRHYDVSAVKLFCRSLGMAKLPRAESHRAKDDVLESIDHARRCAGWLADWGRGRT